MADRPISDYQFEQFLQEEKLMGARCVGCGVLFVPPRAICTKCHGSEMEWVETKGEGQPSRLYLHLDWTSCDDRGGV